MLTTQEKCKRKYFQWVRAFSCVIGLNAQWRQLVPGKDSISVWWISDSYISTQLAVHHCATLCVYIYPRKDEHIMCSKLVISAPIQWKDGMRCIVITDFKVNFWILHLLKLGRNELLIIFQLFFPNLIFLLLSKFPI